MNKSYTLAFQNLLYKKPLYQFVGKKEKDMNILVLGWNLAAEVFIDQCLQAGQMDSHKIKICVLTDNAQESKRKYLDPRPAMADFVNVNGSLNDSSKSCYGTLNFKTFRQMEDLINERESREDIIIDVLSDVPGEKYHYYLVSLNDAALNEEISTVIAKVNHDLGEKDPCSVNFVTESTDIADVERGINPVYVNGVSSLIDIDPNLERMAFNVYLSWADSVIGDPVAEFNKFKAVNNDAQKEYNYLSSLAMALSVKYKLAEFDIDISDTDKAAENFENMLMEDNQGDKLRNLNALEHRRWVLEKAADGWQAPDPEKMEAYYQECFKRCDVKDEKNKLHLCMVRSSNEPIVSSPKLFDKDLWDKFTSLNDGLNQVPDELDRISIKLHRAILRQAELYRDSDPLFNPEGNVKQIENKLIKEGILESPQNRNGINNPVEREWKRYISCLSYILDQSKGYSKKYEYYRDCFLKTAKDSNISSLNFVEEKIGCIDKEIWSSIEANMYRDYREYDDILVKNIPFILTYRIGLTMAVPFSVTNKLNSQIDALFQNVASATVIKPKRILYLLNVSEKINTSLVNLIVKTIRQYFENREMDCDICFAVAGSENSPASKKQQWRRVLKKLSKENIIQSFEVNFADDVQEAFCNMIGDFTANGQKVNIDLYDGSTALFSSMQDNASFIQKIQQKIPYFEFDSQNKRFHNNETCRFISYIRDSTYLGIEEMFSLSGAEDMEFNFPNLGKDYVRLWEIYKGKGWSNKKVEDATSCWKDLCNALNNIKESNVIDIKDLEIQVYEVSRRPSHEKWNEILALIGVLADNGYLIAEKENNVFIKFSFANQEIRKLLTKAGEMLEEYVYYSVCNSGWFDDIAAGYHFQWHQKSEEDKLIDNELDIVVTKGFRSMIIECKDQSKLIQDFYYKLDSLTHLFGINSQGVLVSTADTSTRRNDRYQGGNKEQEERGRLMGIVTISRKNDRNIDQYNSRNMGDIEQIGDKLKVLL